MSAPAPPAGPPRPTASAWLDFDRPVAVVRAAFLDVDLAVRGKIHRGMRLQWLPPGESGERRLRQHVRVLDRIQTEDVVIEEGRGGTWVKRFVEGPNAGTRFEARFEALGDAATRVTMDAWAGKNGFAQGLGKLSPVGREKAMKRVMTEYKTALQGYEPGRARGAVLAAVEQARASSLAIRSLDEERRKQLAATLLEAVWAVACADDEGPDEAERDALRAIVASIWKTALDRSLEDRMVEAAVRAIAKEGVEARCRGLGARLKALGFGPLGLSLAVLVAEVSHGLDAAELDALRTMAAAAGLDDVALADAIRRIDEALSGGDPLSRISRFV